MATPKIIVYFGFEPGAREWVEKFRRHFETPITKEWLHIVEDEISLPGEGPLSHTLYARKRVAGICTNQFVGKRIASYRKTLTRWCCL